MTDQTSSIPASPKVFISYAWSTDAHECLVHALASRLMSDGIMVVWDKWDLKEGQDKYAFMEQCVVDPTIDKVLLICDKVYSTKANERRGGVGDETSIISAEIYGKVKQEKFIPIIFEREDNGEACCPAYVKSRIYVNLSEEEIYETEYEKLLRNLHNCPIYLKHALGHKPEWLGDTNVNLYSLESIIKKICQNEGKNDKKRDALIRQFKDEFIDKLAQYELLGKVTGTLIVDKIGELKPLRDIYLEYLSACIILDIPVADVITDFMENLYNGIYEISVSSQYGRDHYLFFCWEIFICTIAYLFYCEEYACIYRVCHNTYFLKNGYGRDEKEATLLEFRNYLKSIEESYPNETNQSHRLYSYMTDILIRREHRPIITKESIVFADTLLFQLTNLFNKEGMHRWFPMSYCYDDFGSEQKRRWIKLKSRKYCHKILPLFGVSNIEKLKHLISREKIPDGYGYNGSWHKAYTFSDTITAEDIGSLP